ncbi:MAG TPA: adenylate/guanylate cyclase domain-containing protein, partial [Candidatus Limnocylindrales bacterium]|nr:adenylate/guanylate cyclase domain-containing protein [Candidatus Limnocylindrales bacterium]
MDGIAAGLGRALSPRALIWLFHVALPLLGLAVLVARPELDVGWEDHPAHFGLILATAVVNVALAVVVGRAALARRDARLSLVGLAFASAAGFFAIHALATPSVVLATPNASFVLSTPLGIVLAGAFGLVSARDLTPEASRRILERRAWFVALVVAAIAGWAVLSLVGGSPLQQPLSPDRARPILRVLAVVGIVLELGAAVAYYRLNRRRPSVVLLATITAFVLLAEALVGVAESRSWRASWWEWHVLLLLAFGYIAYSAHVEYRREGSATTLFRAFSLEQTVRRLEQEYAAALERLVGSLEAAAAAGEDVDPGAVAARLTDRFPLTEGQADVLAQAGRALAAERREVRRLGLFRRYLSPEVAHALLADPDQAALGGATVETTVLFADLRGFTAFSERSDPAAVVALLNAYFGAAVPIVLREGGTIVQFIGDALMAIFNAPVRQPDHALRAARAALAMQEAVGTVAAGHPDWPRFRVGIASGPAVVGNVGSDEVRSFTAIGDTVNLAARLEASAEVGRVVVSAATAAALGGAAELRRLEPLRLKGKSGPVEAFELLAVHGPAGSGASGMPGVTAAPHGEGAPDGERALRGERVLGGERVLDGTPTPDWAAGASGAAPVSGAARSGTSP